MPPVKPNLPTREDIQKRLKDEMLGLGEKVDLSAGGNEPPLPTVKDLGLPLSVTVKLKRDVSEHSRLGVDIRRLTKQRDTLTANIKGALEEYDVSVDETPSFICETFKVTRFTQDRTSFSRDAARDELLKLGVSPDKIQRAWKAATTVTPTLTLKITAPGQNEGGE